MWRCPDDFEWNGWTEDYQIECPNNEEKIFKGAFWELLVFIQQARNCTFSLIKSIDLIWGGECYDSNNCTGMIGMVNRKEVDFALGRQFFTNFVVTIIPTISFCLIQAHSP